MRISWSESRAKPKQSEPLDEQKKPNEGSRFFPRLSRADLIAFKKRPRLLFLLALIRGKSQTLDFDDSTNIFVLLFLFVVVVARGVHGWVD
ncbi:hypothetical protein QYF36_015714 [Acer negundo]|nr:hypothetical protein QYF36_015714 [Acer negundo]